MGLCLWWTTGAGAIDLVSVRSPLAPAGSAGAGNSENGVITPDGRFVLFSSTADNLTLVTNAGPVKMNVYLRNRTNGTTALVSMNLAGTGGGNGDSIGLGISTNGRYALFVSLASDLVPSDTNNTSDVFVRDLVAGTTVVVSVGTNGAAGSGESRSAAMTPDGRYVAFVSSAKNLVPGDSNGIPDIFVRDLVLGTTTLASPGGKTAGPTVYADAPQITPDGRYVAFYSTATKLTSWTTPGQLYVRDLFAGTTTAIVTNTSTILPPASTISYNHVISDDGRFVAFESSWTPGAVGSGIKQSIFRYDFQSGAIERVSSNVFTAANSYTEFQSLDMTPDGRFIVFIGETNNAPGQTNTCVVVWDGQTATTTLVSGDPDGNVPTNSACASPTVDASGRLVSFLSSATNLTTTPVEGGDFHLYIHDLLAGTNRLVDIGTNGVASSKGIWNAPGLTANSRYVLFDCDDTDLAAGDGNGACDVFLRDLETETNELISARAPDLPGATADGAVASGFSASSDGRYIAFASDAWDLVANDTNRMFDIFLHDQLTGTNVLISVDTNGMAPGSGYSSLTAMSADGRCVAFCSTAGSLVTGDSNKLQDVFVRDLTMGTTALVSIGTNGAPGDGPSVLRAMSDDGRYILFSSKARNLVTGGSTPFENLFLRDLQSGTTTAIMATNASDAGSLAACMSRNGQVVAFFAYSDFLTKVLYIWTPQDRRRVNASTSLDLYAISGDGRRIAYLVLGKLWIYDRIANTNIDVSDLAVLDSVGRPTPQFSDDAALLAYAKIANGSANVYVFDYAARTDQLISRSYSSGSFPNGRSDRPTISRDGRFITYLSRASDIVPTVTNRFPQVYLYDRETGTTTIVGPGAFGDGAANHRAQGPVFSGDSRTLVFRSFASDFVASDYNQSADVFSWKLASSDLTFVFSGQMVFAPTSGKSPTLTWPVVSGKNYEVQFKDDLSDPFWQPMAGTVTIVGDRAYATDLAPSPTHRFYRIRAY